jgi:hypothetical protein
MSRAVLTIVAMTTAIMLAVRAIVAYKLFSAGGLAIVFGAGETLALGLGVWNCVGARMWDGRPVAGLLPAVYGCSLLVSVESQGVSLWAVLVVYLGICTSRVVLWKSYSVGAATWSRLVDYGPYKVIRHPQYLLYVVGVAVAAAGAGSLGAWSMLGFALAIAVVAVVLEEGFLKSIDQWREYAARVRWRLLPGVW